MRITLIIASLEAEERIAQCLASIECQDYPDVEVLVVDGGSHDYTTEILKRYGQTTSRPFVWISEPDQGIADAWNKAVARSTGEWLLFLGADDLLAAPDIVSRAAGVLQNEASGHRIVYGQVALVSSGGRALGVLDRPWDSASFRGCRYNLPHQAVFHHRSIFDDRGKFDSNLKIVADFDLLLRELMFAEPLYVADFVVCDKLVGGISTSGRYAPLGVVEQIRLFRRHVGGTSPILYWCWFKAWIKCVLYVLGGGELVAQVACFRRSLFEGAQPRARSALSGWTGQLGRPALAPIKSPSGRRARLWTELPPRE